MISRIDVRSSGADPFGESIRQQIRELGHAVGEIRTVRIFLIDLPNSAPPADVRRIARELLADPVVEDAQIVSNVPDRADHSRIEIHLKPGVMDPIAASTEMAIRDMGIDIAQVRTGRAFLFSQTFDESLLQQIAARLLANGVIETVHFRTYIPTEFPAGHEQPFLLKHVSLRELNDDALKKLSREGHLFLSLAEMKAIQSYYREQSREPTDVELETLAQTWSEHCVHKTLKSAVEVVDETGAVVRRYGNLIKETIFKSTQELMAGEPAGEPALAGGAFCLSVFKDNAGVIAFDETDAVCFKVETHNHPSAIEPYGGSATGIGGVIRDVLGTGLAAKPVANTDVFCVAFPDAASSIPNPQSKIQNLPKGVIHPKRILQQVVAGVRDYGNRMGIPTINGAVYFDDRYLGNPLVFCGCVGLLPRDKIEKQARSGDAIVLMGGRTGRDGIHGATFSSAELTDTHADEFSHAVQIGNAITEKKMADVILQARDLNLFSAITDLGAGGLSSAVGEMAEKLGAFVNLDTVPLKYAGLRYDEIWISEAQERMLLSVPAEHVQEILKLGAGEDVETVVIGHFGTDSRELVLQYRHKEVCRLSMRFLHEGLPMPTRRAVVAPKKAHGWPSVGFANDGASVRDNLLSLLSHPNIASKHWIIRQYDHEVQGGSVVKPLVGPQQIGPSDASVIRPKLSSYKGVVVSCGMAPQIEDPYAMAIASIDEAIRNAVAVGADPGRLAILDNFCWPSVDDERTMGTLVAACEACHDAAKAYGVPFISGKDSLHNQFTNQETGQVLKIPNTLLISAIGVIEDVRKCVTMDLKGGPDRVVAIAKPRSDALDALAAAHRAIARIIRDGKVASCHDISDGGALVAVAEMCIASGLGLELDADQLGDPFGESPGRYLIEIDSQAESVIGAALAAAGVELQIVGKVTAAPAALEVGRRAANRSRHVEAQVSVDELTKAWRGTLDWRDLKFEISL